mgnify:CR=1 FL=1
MDTEVVRSLDPPTSVDVGYAEQSAQQWWEAMADSCAALGKHVESIQAIALSGQMQGVLLVDAHGEPILPALLYSDSRARAEAAHLEEKLGQERLLRGVQNWKGAVSVLPKLCWLHHHCPDLLERANHILLGAHDWLFFRLTGLAVTDLTNASVSGLLRADKDEWAFQLLLDAGLPASIAAKLPELATGGPAVAFLLPAAASRLRLSRGSNIKVCHGAGDLGTTTRGALGERSVGTYCYLGTSGWVATQRSTISEQERGRAFCVLGASRERRYLLAAPMTTAGGNLRWLLGVMWPGLPESDAYVELESEASNAPPGCGGVLYLPYLSGERCPVKDPQARACFIGMGVGTTRGILCRAVMEGICFAMRSLLELLPGEHLAHGAKHGVLAATNQANISEDDGHKIELPPPPLVVVGGVAASRTVVQTLANVMQREVHVPSAFLHAPALGAAWLAFEAINDAEGENEDDVERLKPSSPNDVDFKDTSLVLLPDSELKEMYDTRYRAFCMLHPALRETFPLLRAR